MDISREIARAPKSRQLVQALAELKGPCIGCKDCTGLCAALIELLILPDAVRSR